MTTYDDDVQERVTRYLDAATAANGRRQPPRQPSFARLLHDMLGADNNMRHDSNAAAEWARSDCNSATRDKSTSIAGGMVSTPGRRDAAIVDWGWAAREMNAGSGSKGGFAVGVDALSPVESAFSDSALSQLGVQFVPGLTTAAAIPRATAPLEATWLATGGSVTAADPTLGSASLTPRPCLASVSVSIALLKQAPAAQDFVGRLVMRAVLNAIEKAALQGTGAEQPLGIINVPGVTSVSGASLTWATAVSAQRTLCAAGASDSRLRWCGGPVARETLQTRERIASSGRAIWESGSLADTPAVCSPFAPSTTAILGDWSQLIVALWSNGIEIRLDPSGGFNTGMVTVQAVVMADIVTPQPQAFLKVVSIT